MTQEIAVVCIYFRDGMITRIAEDFAAQGAELHLWALDEVLPSVARWTRGCGRYDKTTNLNSLFEYARESKYVLFTDDDIEFPPNFLSPFFEKVKHYGFDLAQPALSSDSDYSWISTLGQPEVIARRVNYVEQMVVAMSNRMLQKSLPYPSEFWMGWGIEMLWERTLREQNWNGGIVDALTIKHGSRPMYARYDRQKAMERMHASLRSHGLSYLAQRTFSSWRTNGGSNPLSVKAAELAKCARENNELKLLLGTDGFWFDAIAEQERNQYHSLPGYTALQPRLQDDFCRLQRALGVLGVTKDAKSFQNPTELLAFTLEVMANFYELAWE